MRVNAHVNAHLNEVTMGLMELVVVDLMGYAIFLNGFVLIIIDFVIFVEDFTGM